MFMESEFGCKMFLLFILLVLVQSGHIMTIPHIILPHDILFLFEFHGGLCYVKYLYEFLVVSRRNGLCLFMSVKRTPTDCVTTRQNECFIKLYYNC